MFALGIMHYEVRLFARQHMVRFTKCKNAPPERLPLWRRIHLRLLPVKLSAKVKKEPNNA